MDKPLPTEAFIINFVPDESYVESVVTNPDYKEFFDGNMDPLKAKMQVVYHSTEKLAVI